MNRPILTTNTNLLDETSACISGPSTINGVNLIVAQEQQRKILDSMNTSFYGMNNNTTPMSVPPHIQANKQYIPGGATFSFANPQNMYTNVLSSQSQPICPPMTPQPCTTCLEQQLALHGMQKNCLEMLKFQEQMNKNQFQLNFHQTQKTSTTDLLPSSNQIQSSGGLPDLKSVCGSMKLDVCACTIDTNPNRRKLYVTTTPDMKEGHVVEVLDKEEEEKENNKKVSFSVPMTICACGRGKKDAEVQAGTCIRRRKPKLKKTRSTTRSRSNIKEDKNLDSDNSSSSSSSDYKCKRKRRRNRKKRKVDKKEDEKQNKEEEILNKNEGENESKDEEESSEIAETSTSSCDCPFIGSLSIITLSDHEEDSTDQETDDKPKKKR